MPNYTFLNLSPVEFEEFVRDLLQKQLKLSLESFTGGRDAGIDLRHIQVKTGSLVIQCKRHENFKTLLSDLKKEVLKVRKLHPRRYILATSVGLTPGNKKTIFSLFTPYIKTESDILGRNDLNNLLGQFPEIEGKHYKLWLSSTNILQKLLYSKIHNQSSFEEDVIRETIRLYVENASFKESIDIIRDNNFVIISGIPGIGKTTLARILVYYLLANGFDEFIFLSDSINDGYTAYKETVPQVFLFDDFLGRNFLNKTLNNNEEQRIARFIDRIRKSDSKVLIFTTREYILQQAKQRYDVFEDKALTLAKCIIDLSQYTVLIRAKILYNHLYFSSLKRKYIDHILENEDYLQIIRHRNFNPRLIETITNERFWGDISPSEFSKSIHTFLDNPEEIWRHAFENQISNFSKCLLANLMSAGTPMFLDDLKELIQTFASHHSKKYEIAWNEIEFNKSIRELENSFIRIFKDDNDSFIVEYQNPSVQDFLVNYFSNLPDFLNDIISSAIYFNQLFTVFTLRTKRIYGNQIVLNAALKELLGKKVMDGFDSMGSSKIYRSPSRNDRAGYYWKNTLSKYGKLRAIRNSTDRSELPTLRKYVIATFNQNINPDYLFAEDFSDYIDLLEQFRDVCQFDPSSVMSAYAQHIAYVTELEEFLRFKKLFPEEFDRFIRNDAGFATVLEDLAYNESDDATADDGETRLEALEFIENHFEVDLKAEKDLVEEKIATAERPETNLSRVPEITDNLTENDVDDDILREMFQSL